MLRIARECHGPHLWPGNWQGKESVARRQLLLASSVPTIITPVDCWRPHIPCVQHLSALVSFARGCLDGTYIRIYNHGLTQSFPQTLVRCPPAIAYYFGFTMTEPFPPLNGGLPHNPALQSAPRRRRKSSALGADVPGDVDVPSLATYRSVTPPLHSPVTMDSVCVVPFFCTKLP